MTNYHTTCGDLTQDRSRLDKSISARVGKSTRRHIRWLDKEIERLDEEYKELLKHSDNLCGQADLYRSVPGVGQLAAATLVAYLPELGQRDGKVSTPFSFFSFSPD